MLESNLSLLAGLAIIIPFISGLGITMLPRQFGKWICIVAAGISTSLLLMLWTQFAASGLEAVYVPLVAFGNTEIIGFVFDQMSILLAPCFVGIGFLIAIYSIGYMSPKNREHADAPRRRFYAYFTVFIGCMAGLVFSSTLISQLIFFEITGACSWALIGYYDTPSARKSAAKALIVTHLAALGLFVASGMLFVETGTFAISALAEVDAGIKTAILLCVLIAAWGKSAQLPFYMWLPSAMEAPTPVSAYLHGASMVKVGVAVFARVLAEAGVIPEAVGWVVVIGALATMLFAFFMYLPQKDMKRLLAFSTISQLAYIFMGFGFFIFGSNLAFEGGVMHMFNHAFAKTLFFLVAGAFSFTLGTRMLPKIKGVLKKQPLLGVGFAVAALAIAGVPPMNGFFSKFAIFSGSFEAALSTNWLLFVMVIVALIETVACFAWFMKWIGSVLPGEPSETVAKAQPLPKSMAIVFIVLIFMSVASSFIAAAWLG